MVTVKYSASSHPVFLTISGWKNADEQIDVCRKKIEEIQAKEEAYRQAAKNRAKEQRIAAEQAARKRKKIIAVAQRAVVISGIRLDGNLIAAVFCFQNIIQLK